MRDQPTHEQTLHNNYFKLNQAYHPFLRHNVRTFLDQRKVVFDLPDHNINRHTLHHILRITPHQDPQDKMALAMALYPRNSRLPKVS